MTGPAIRPPDFDQLYRRDPDPWQVGTSWYEQRKAGTVTASLTRAHYRSVWDPACGTGHLARRLADRADRVLATDGSPDAVAISRRTCAGVPNVELAVCRLPAPPPGRTDHDLIVLSEFVYYLTADARSATLGMLPRLTEPVAEVVAVHWRHRPHDAYCSGAEAQQEIVDTLGSVGWAHPVHHLEDDFVLDVLTREPSR